MGVLHSVLVKELSFKVEINFPEGVEFNYVYTDERNTTLSALEEWVVCLLREMLQEQEDNDDSMEIDLNITSFHTELVATTEIITAEAVDRAIRDHFVEDSNIVDRDSEPQTEKEVK